MTHFLQSPAWNAFQTKLGRKTITDQGEGWSYFAVQETGTLNSRLYTPYGPEFNSLGTFDAALSSLTSAAHIHHATFIRIEPTSGLNENDLRKRGFRPVTYQQLQPAHTLIVDLSEPTETILGNMSQNSRNITRNYKNKGVTIRASYNPADITILTTLLSGVAARNHIKTHNADYFTSQAVTLFPEKKAVLYIAEYESQPIAAALVYDSPTTRYYAHAAADDTYRKLSAGTALVGQMILDAKAAGFAAFDLYGVADTDDPHHPWAGFTKFKRSFGGATVNYLGPWDLPINKPGYFLYRTYQSIYRRLRS
jgi:lipid II:glycine glycyltransferase (peptidoglycan interpeptide bridge formation enzyme)